MMRTLLSQLACSARLMALAILAGTTLAGCGAMKTVEIQQPLSVRPPLPPEAGPANGAIFRAALHRPLFEDRRARAVGDTLTININEKLQASKQSSSTAGREGNVSLEVPTLTGLPGKSFKDAALAAESASAFTGKGDSSAGNVFSGAITVTVIDVFPNGNLLVSGEKQIGINQGSEFIRLSGVVNPATILAGNVVLSTQVADARIEYRGTGYIDEAQTMGWLQRVFLSVLPF